MVYQPPAGARDLLPLDVAQKRWIEDRLQQVFDRWGYHRIITSTLERMDTLMAGGAIGRSTVIQLHSLEDEELGLRPELTASIARTAVTRLADASYPQRLYYNTNVFQRTPELKHNRQQEFYQAGIELLGSDALLADAEVLLLLADCLQALSFNSWYLILGDAGITRSLLSVFPPNSQASVRHAIATLDYVAIDTLPLSDELRDRAKFILDLRGWPGEVLAKVSSLGLNTSQEESVNNLKSLSELLSSRGNYPVILDLSLIQTIDYYTGIVFEVVTDTDQEAQVLGRGGRYDQLLGLYHPQGENIPGIGFALSLDNLYKVLSRTQQLPQKTPETNWLVIPENKQAYTAAFAYAEKLRNSNHLVRVEMDFGDRDSKAIREYAFARGIPQIAWVKNNGSAVIEKVM